MWTNTYRVNTRKVRRVPITSGFRLKVGWSVYQKTCFSLKVDIFIHNWTSKKICSIRYTQYVHILFWTSRKWLYLRPQNSTRSRPPKAADFFGCFFCLLYNHFLGVQNKIYTYWVYLMEHICFEVQLCIKISIFKEKPVFDILIILCLMTSLPCVSCEPFGPMSFSHSQLLQLNHNNQK